MSLSVSPLGVKYIAGATSATASRAERGSFGPR